MKVHELIDALVKFPQDLDLRGPFSNTYDEEWYSPVECVEEEWIDQEGHLTDTAFNSVKVVVIR